MSGVKVIAPPTEEPLTIEECRAHLEAPIYGDSDVDAIDDEMILGWLGAAREHCEGFLGLSLSQRVLELALDRFPSSCKDGTTGIDLPFGPVIEVREVIVSDPSSDSSPSDLASTDYMLDDYSSPPRLYPAAGLSWPAVQGTNAIKVRYLAGYGVDSDGGTELPRVFRAAILLTLGDLYCNREDSTEKAMTSLPNGVEALLRPHRVLLGMA